MTNRKVLFLSALDFKDKSIQVIKKTPVAYADNGWKVDYVVARDNCPTGNYFYEPEINLDNVNIIRIYWPLAKLKSKLPRFLSLIVNKLASLIVVFRLAYLGFKQIRKNDYDLIYGYELQGILAMNVLKFFGLTRKMKTISRIQGTFLNEMFESKAYGRLLFNLDLILAIRLKSDLLIMTNDGTQGDKAIERIRGNKKSNHVFWVNGVENMVFLPENKQEIIDKYNLQGKHIFLSISRLVGWKKVDRGITILSELKRKGNVDFKYLIVGDGDNKPHLEKLVDDLNLSDNVIFVGAVKNEVVKDFLNVTDFFISMYDSSNVGNPLLEAIRANKLIVTLNNGDTGSWIKHKVNGLIYNFDENLFEKAAIDINELCEDKNLFDDMILQTKKLEDEKLKTWDERFDLELKTVANLF